MRCDSMEFDAAFPPPASRAVRGVAAYRKLHPQGDYTMIAVEPTSIKPAEQHAAANGIPADKTVLLQIYIKTPDDLALVLGKAEHFDFLGECECERERKRGWLVEQSRLTSPLSVYVRGSLLADLDCQTGERTAFDSADVLATLDAKVKRLHVGTHGQDIHADLQVLFLSLGWIPTMNYIRNPRWEGGENQ